MHIQKIEVANVLGLARADIVCKTGVTLVAGNNMSGKSSLRDAISMALLGQPCRVNLKKELDQLLHDGAKKGRVAIYAEGDVAASYTLPKGEHAAPAWANDFLHYVLDPARFAALSNDDRRTALFKLTGCNASMKVIEPLLAKRKINMDLFNEAMPMLRNGFPAAEKYAADREREEKGAWRAVTGETWGSDKADGWAMAVPASDVTDEQIAAARAELEESTAQIEKGNQHLGMLQANQQAAAGYEERTAELTEKASMVQRARAKLEATQADLDQWQPKLDQLRARQAVAANAEKGCECPSCGALLRIVGAALEPMKAGEKVDMAEINAELQKANDAVALLRRTLANDQQAVATAEQAARDLEQHQANKPQAATEDEIERTQNAINHFRQLRDQQNAKLNALDEARDAQASAKATNEKAAQHHTNIMQWLEIAEAMAPDGIPGELLSNALEPINQSLAVLAGMAKWPTVEITKDIEITSNGRRYSLCSESEKWRADTLLALAIAQISGLKLAVLDRFDVLELKARGQLLGMLCELVKLKSIDSVIMLGTMKEMPSGLPAEVTGIWINNSIAETA